VKKVRSKGRRASAKLGIGGKGKKRKADSDDSDSEFAAVKRPKTAAARLKEGLLRKPESKAAGVYPIVNGVEQKPVVVPAQQMTLPTALEKAKPIAEIKETASSKLAKAKPEAPAPKPAAKQAQRKKIKVESDDDDSDDDVFAAVAEEAASKPGAVRTGRAVAQKPKSYNLESDEETSDDQNDRLGDLSTIVKGVGANTGEGATRLYHPPSVSRPSSAHGIKPKPRKTINDDSDISPDETDWAGLAQNSPKKATNRTILSDDDDDMEIDDKPPPKPAVKAEPKAKPAPKPKKSAAALKPKKAPAPAAPVIKPLSPAAKAYAAKQAKVGALSSKPGALKPIASKANKKKTVDSDDDDDDDDDVDALANDILSDEDSPAKTAARPVRRAAAAPKSRYVVEDDVDEDEDEESEAEFDDDESD
jgi:DNA topoisomerase-2